MSRIDELKPCPFCGNKAELTAVSLFDGWYADYNYMIACKTPGCVTMISYDVGCESIVKRWNTREQPEEAMSL